MKDVDALVEKDLRRGMPRFQGENWPHNLALIKRFEMLAIEAGVTPAQLSLAWVLSRGEHVVAIPGTASITHLEENIAQWDWPLPGPLAAELDTLINQQTVAGPRYPAAIQQGVGTEEFA